MVLFQVSIYHLSFRCIRASSAVSFACLRAYFHSVCLYSSFYLYYLFNVVVAVITVIVVAAIVVVVVAGFVNSAVKPCGEHVYSHSLTLFIPLYHVACCFCTFTANKGNYKIDGNEDDVKKTSHKQSRKECT